MQYEMLPGFNYELGAEQSIEQRATQASRLRNTFTTS